MSAADGRCATSSASMLPRHPLIDRALADACAWYAGRTLLDQGMAGVPALTHACGVAATVDYHAPAAGPALVAAAALIHAPEFGPPGATLTVRYGPVVARVVAALHLERLALAGSVPPAVVQDAGLQLVSTAEKIITLTALRDAARATDDPAEFLSSLPGTPTLLRFAKAVRSAGISRVPASMSGHLRVVLDGLESAALLAGRVSGAAR